MPAHHAGENTAIARPRLRVVQAAEAQRIEHRDGPRAHGEDVAQNAAHARGRALKRLDEAGVVVRFDLERDHVTAADIHDAGVLSGPLHHQLAARRQLLQVQPRAFVRAVLAPHHAENAELGIARLAPQDVEQFSRYSAGVSWCCATTSGVIAVAVMRAPPRAAWTGKPPVRRSSP